MGIFWFIIEFRNMVTNILYNIVEFILYIKKCLYGMPPGIYACVINIMLLMFIFYHLNPVLGIFLGEKLQIYLK